MTKDELYIEPHTYVTFIGITWDQVAEMLGHDPKGTPEEDAVLSAAIREAAGIDAEPIDGFVDEYCWYLVYRN